MAESIGSEFQSDQLGEGVPGEHSTVLPVLGIRVRFESDAAEIIAAVEDAFGIWRVVDGLPRFLSAERVLVRFMVHLGGEGTSSHPPFTYYMPDRERVIVSTPGSIGISDSARREVVAYVTPALVSERDHFRYGLLEALTLALLTRLDRQPLHAAALVRGGTGLGERATRATRIPAGHPEGYLEAFANIYLGAIEAIRANQDGCEATGLGAEAPTIEDGVRGVRFIELCVESACGGTVWVDWKE